MKLNVESEAWFLKPEMVGHNLAKEQVQLVKSFFRKWAKTKAAKELFRTMFNLESTDWHYWCMHVTKKDLNHFRYVSRRLGKQSFLTLLHWHNTASGVLKSSLTWFLEVKAFQEDKEPYYRYYRGPFVGLGMSDADCRQRFESYHEKMQIKLAGA